MNEMMLKGDPKQYEELLEWRDYYKARYEKAHAQHIDESSRFYPAFKEIEQRYIVLEYAIDFYEMVSDYLKSDNAEALVTEYLTMIFKQLFIGYVMRNEQGKKEFIWQRIKIQRTDEEACEAYEASKKAGEYLCHMDFSRSDKDEMASELQTVAYIIVRWNMIYREILLPVNRSQKKKEVCSYKN